MTRNKAKPGRGRHWPRLLFLIPLAAMAWVPSYNRVEPALAGIPFFYWYQLAWIVIGSAIVLAVYLIEGGAARGEKALDDEADGVPGDIL